jgi:folate-dependent tRNA-U54 methylase TrmFO/GidA
MYNPNHHKVPIIEMYLFHYIYVHFQLECKYTTIKSRHFQPMKMNFELKSNISTRINERQVELLGVN